MLRLRLLVALIVPLAAAGCGGSHDARQLPVITAKQWRAVLSDWADNSRIDGRYSCGAVVEAVAQTRAYHLPFTPKYQHLVPTLDRYAAGVCPRKPRLSRIVVGMTDAEVAEVAGMPRTLGLHCWLYPVTHDATGRRVCFARGRAVLVQTSVHA